MSLMHVTKFFKRAVLVCRQVDLQCPYWLAGRCIKPLPFLNYSSMDRHSPSPMPILNMELPCIGVDSELMALGSNSSASDDWSVVGVVPLAGLTVPQSLAGCLTVPQSLVPPVHVLECPADQRVWVDGINLRVNLWIAMGKRQDRTLSIHQVPLRNCYQPRRAIRLDQCVTYGLQDKRPSLVCPLPWELSWRSRVMPLPRAQVPAPVELCRCRVPVLLQQQQQ